MDIKHSLSVRLTVLLALAIAAVVLLLLTFQAVGASPGIAYVAPGGNCGGATPCFSTVQAAVDAAQPGDEIRVAAGTYSGVNDQGGLSQVVYVTKSLILRGGFTTSNWNSPDPDANVTEINAQTLGRVVYVSGEGTTVTLDGLRLTYGDATGLGGHNSYDAGGGVYISQAGVTIERCTISHNYAPSSGYGGGLYVRYGSLHMVESVLEENEGGHGGGAFLSEAQTEIGSNSLFRSNRASSTFNTGSAMRVEGGALTLRQSRLVSNEDGPALSANGDPLLIEGSVISDTQGGGVQLAGGGSLIQNLITGGPSYGLSLGDGTFLVEGNEISYNQGDGYSDDPGVVLGGLSNMTIKLIGNHIHHNQNTYSASHGGGVYIDAAASGWITLTGNLIEENIAGEQAGLPSHGYGGGLYISGSNVTLERNVIRNNVAVGFIWAGTQYWGGYGGGLYINDHPILINNVVAGNVVAAPDTTHFHAPGIYVRGGSPELIHNTIAHNQGGDGVGLYVAEDEERSQVQMFNTIVVSHMVGIYAAGEVVENIVMADGILWSGNVSDTWGTGAFFLSHEHTGAPAFADPAGGDYHIDFGSAAIDAGQDAGIGDDIDGESRPHYGGYDLGADEWWPLVATKSATPGTAAPGEVVTYTLSLINSTLAPMTVRLTDTLPAEVGYVGPLLYNNGSGSYSSGVIMWTGDVPTTTPTLITWTVEIGPEVSGGSTVANTAVISEAYDLFQAEPALVVVARQGNYIYLPLVVRG